ncbi:MAG: hypothetical protein KA059_02365 [Elusimicrobiales bacterium]|nr:hypothetical protein [Elusimicrobiales bacterium]
MQNGNNIKINLYFYIINLDSLGIEWVELRNDTGFKKFEKVLNNLNIPHNKLPENIDNKLENIFKEIFK